MKYFCTVTGRYISLLFCQDHTHEPANKAMLPIDLAAFLVWKTFPKGTIIKDLDGKTIFNLKGQPFLADGGWKAPGCVKVFFAAMRTLHKSRDQPLGAYEKPCDPCWQIHNENQSRSAKNMPVKTAGCVVHSGNPNLWSKGYCANDARVQEAMKESLDQLNGHVSNGDDPLLPKEILDAIDHCIDGNTVLLILLLSMKLRLRLTQKI